MVIRVDDLNQEISPHFYFQLVQEVAGGRTKFLSHEVLELLNQKNDDDKFNLTAHQDLEERFQHREKASRKILKVVSKTLNDFHGVGYSEESWHLLLGHWIERYVSSFVQREFDLKRILSVPKLQNASVKPGMVLEVAWDTEDATRVFNSEAWDAFVNREVLETAYSSFPLIRNPIDLKTRSPEIKASNPGPKGQLLRLADLMTRSLSTRAKYFIHTPYLPLLSSTKAHLALRQFPQMWHSESNKPLASLDVDLRREMRRRFVDNYLAIGDVTESEKVMVENLSISIPISFLEGFQALGDAAETRGWPRGPKVIFTSNRFDTDDVFKLYVVRQRQNGSRYYVGQHGNNYGTKRTMFPSIEEVTSDKFFTWGWSIDSSKHVTLFNLKMAGMQNFPKKKRAQLLLLQTHRAHAYELENPFVSHDRYFSWQVRFYDLLGSEAKALLRVRFHSGHVFFGWGETERWMNMLRGGTTISSSAVPIFREFSRSRLVVHTYDSTGMLETLAGNVPTVAFWPMGLSHLTKEAEQDYQKLISAKIVHLSPESAANHINLVLQDVDAWWGSSVVQKARMDFVAKYSRLSPRPIRELAHALRGEDSLAR